MRRRSATVWVLAVALSVCGLTPAVFADTDAVTAQAQQYLSDANAAVKARRWADADANYAAALAALTAALPAEKNEVRLHNLRSLLITAEFGQAQSLDVLRGRHRDALDHYQAAIRYATDDADQRSVAVATNGLAGAQLSLGDLTEAGKQFAAALSVAANLKDARVQAVAQNGAGYVALARGDDASAATSFRQSVEQAKAAGDADTEARAQHGLGLTEWHAGQADRASATFELALKLARQAGDSATATMILLSLGRVEVVQNQLTRAADAFDQAQSEARARGSLTDEAAATAGLGSANLANNNYDAALKNYRAALDLARRGGSAASEADALHGLGTVYADVSRFKEAGEWYSQSLDAANALHDQRRIAAALHGLANTQVGLGDFAGATSTYHRAETVEQSLGDRAGQAATQLGLGAAYANQSEYAAAIEAFGRARELGDARTGALALRGLGDVYRRLHDDTGAEQAWQSALQAARDAHDQAAEAAALTALGGLYAAQNKDKDALAAYQQAESLARGLRDRGALADALAGQANLFITAGDDARARDALQTVLAARRELSDPSGEAAAQSALGLVDAHAGHDDDAARDFHTALALQIELHDAHGQAATLANLMHLHRARPTLANLFGKQCVNLLQSLRASFLDLDPALQRSFTAGNAAVYRCLADLLLQSRRAEEAEQVLRALKDQELLDFTDRNAVRAGYQATALTYTPRDRLDVAALEASAATLVDLRGRLDRLDAQRRRNLALEDSAAGAQDLAAQLKAAETAFSQRLTASSEFFSGVVGPPEPVDVPEARSLDDDLRAAPADQDGRRPAVLYTLAAADRYWVVLAQPGKREIASYTVPIKALTQWVLTFRAAVQNPHVDPRPLARQLYNVLFAPIAPAIADSGAGDLLWSLDGILRYVPIDALFDGQKYLVERYTNALITLAGRQKLAVGAAVAPRTLAAGVSVATPGFSALPGAGDELAAIAGPKGALPGTLLENEQFRRDSFASALAAHPTVVHLATHFRFTPGDERQSFLVMGDGGHLTVADMNDWPSMFAGVDLLTLSACNTATGVNADGKEVESFAVIAQRKGAKTVLASLWPVSDASTRLLMVKFYQRMAAKDSHGRAECFRLAQLDLLHGEKAAPAAPPADNEHRWPTGDVPMGYQTDPSAPYAHPYYWAPFVVMGDWR